MYVNIDSMSPESRVWIFLSTDQFTAPQQERFAMRTKQFLESWTAHKKELKASHDILFGHLLVVAVDEQINEASGCSIDKLFHFIREMDQLPGLDLLNRLKVAYQQPDQSLKVIKSGQVTGLLSEGVLRPDTPLVDMSIGTLGGLRNPFIPLNQSWLKTYLNHA